jgi:Tfp pilus assembly protein PilF
MSKLVPSLVVLFILIVNANAQIQKTAHNRVFVDEDYEYTEALRRARDVKAQIEKGMSFYNARDYRAAADAFGVAVSLDPSVFVAQHNLGVAHLHLGDFKAAVKDFRTALNLDESSASTWHFLGFALYNLKENEEATKCYAHSLDLDSQSVVTWNNLGVMGSIYFEMKKLKDAKRVFQQALSKAPESPSALYNLGMTCLAMKEKECAREQYAILKTVEPGLSSRLLDQIYSSKVVRLMK